MTVDDLTGDEARSLVRSIHSALDGAIFGPDVMEEISEAFARFQIPIQDPNNIELTVEP